MAEHSIVFLCVAVGLDLAVVIAAISSRLLRLNTDGDFSMMCLVISVLAWMGFLATI